MVWITRYRYKVVSGDHTHMMVSIPPQHAVNDVVRRMKGRSSYKVQHEFPAPRKRYWGRHFWARGYSCTTSGNVTDNIIQYIENQPAGKKGARAA